MILQAISLLPLIRAGEWVIDSVPVPLRQHVVTVVGITVVAAPCILSAKWYDWRCARKRAQEERPGFPVAGNEPSVQRGLRGPTMANETGGNGTANPDAASS